MLSQNTFQHDNILSLTAKEKERERALAALEKAKSIPRKVIFLPKGAGQWQRKEKVVKQEPEQVITDLISIDEAMLKTGYKKPTLQGFFREKKVSGVKIKNKLHFPEEELMRFVSERRARNPVENLEKKYQ